MKTYQDLVEVGQDEKARINFVKQIINEYKSSAMYQQAVIGDDYYKSNNTTIMRYQRTLRSVTGKLVADEFAPNNKITSSFFRIFVCAQNQHLLANGVIFDDEAIKKKLGNTKFDKIVQSMGRNACTHGVTWGFWNLDHIVNFTALEFAPLQDEETGKTRGGVRWWQISSSKPLRATLYEEDGYTEYIWDKKKNAGEGMVLHEKKPYKLTEKKADVDEVAEEEWDNYAGFPIVPFWGNPEHRSEVMAIRNGIDAYDMIKNGYANELDSAQVYWIIRGAGGMDDPSLAMFLDRLRKTGAAAPAEGQDVTPVPLNIPVDARERLLDRIEKDLYRDYMAFDTSKVVNGAATATQIRANYDAGMTGKVDMYEYQVRDFIDAIIELAEGKEDVKYTFQRSMSFSVNETVTSILQGAQYLTKEYITQKLLSTLGDGDLAEDMIEELHANELQAMAEMGMMQGGEQGAQSEFAKDREQQLEDQEANGRKQKE